MESVVFMSPFQGLFCYFLFPQGVALGCLIAARWADECINTLMFRNFNAVVGGNYFRRIPKLKFCVKQRFTDKEISMPETGNQQI